ncbi:hypothetical protein BHU72_03595 [Desulfuribacillus stibiiarsenatis]|uniref:Bile acid:sodium symporter n=1 Tax=Desulfuribacillus stibiiarsenatis TaxID=1390249 RepID=A0A1E5L780_9FIRM|nr:bile acid:sodium symporter [Desulfuribacillus stibiiarsenatis]OEH85874.1 hypothetical protein BHU72_03595 [Desulfuribacillus stibiiarsenatis]
MYILTLPAKKLHIVIPISMVLGFTTGMFFKTSIVKPAILPLTFFMVLSAVYGYPWEEIINKKGTPIIAAASIVNFVFIPIVAWIVIKIFNLSPEFAAGFAILASLPTSSMSIIWTMLAGGNVALAIRLSTLSLIMGAVLLPIYLHVFTGSTLAVPLQSILQSVVVVVLLPLLCSYLISVCSKYFHWQSYESTIKFLLPNINSWILTIIIFLNISMQSNSLFLYKVQILSLSYAFLTFYIVTFSISFFIAFYSFTKLDGIAFIYGTAIRHLSIGLGLAIITFGNMTGFVITFAYIFQAQAAAWFGHYVKNKKWKDKSNYKITENSNNTF